MEITSIYFGILSVTAIFVYYLLDHRYRGFFLAILSCAFIASNSLNLLIYVMAYTLINYFIGLKIPITRFKKTLFRAGIIINLSQLILLKYASFTIDPIFQIFNSSILVIKLSDIIIPIGISFFTLQGIGYLINIKMGWEKPEGKYLNFLLYITFYPKFLSGPIERSNHFLPQLSTIKTFNGQQVTEGLRIALIGFFKKIAIANQLAPYITNTFADLDSFNGTSLWVLFFIMPLYLYFDFSGYTNIAVGFARTFGFELLPNFNRPFLSQNVTMFWKRFHMSLSSWFNDYVFRQLSFKYRRWGIYASSSAVFVTWILFGIWHGAGWNFMILGLLQALVINYEFITKEWRAKLFSRLPYYIRIWSGRIITYLFFCCSMVFFFSHDLSSAFTYFSKLTEVGDRLPLDDLSLMPFMLTIYIPVFLFLEFIQNDFSTASNKLENFWLSDRKINRFMRWTIYSILITIIFVAGDKTQQFVYVNF